MEASLIFLALREAWRAIHRASSYLRRSINRLHCIKADRRCTNSILLRLHLSLHRCMWLKYSPLVRNLFLRWKKPLVWEKTGTDTDRGGRAKLEWKR